MCCVHQTQSDWPLICGICILILENTVIGAGQMRQIETSELRGSASILFIEERTVGLPGKSLFSSKIVLCSHVPTVFPYLFPVSHVLPTININI